MIIIQLLLVIFILLYIQIKWTRRQFTAFAKHYPCDINSLPILGHAHLFFTCKNDKDRWNLYKMFFDEAVKKRGAICVWNMLIPYLCVADPEIAEIILKNNNCLEKNFHLKTAMSHCENSILIIDVPRWRPLRRLLSTTFSRKHLMKSAKIFSKKSMIMVKQLLKLPVKQSVGIFEYISNFAMDSLLETTVGIELKVQESPEQELKRAIFKILGHITDRTTKPWQLITPIYKLTSSYRESTKQFDIIFRFIKNIINIKRKEYANNNNIVKWDDKNNEERLKCFLELMIESSNWSDKVLFDEAVTLFVAGSDTSAVASAFVCVLLARHPNVQEKIRKEIEEVFGESKRPVMYEDLVNLKYLDATIKEALRLYPPIPVIIREVGEDVLLPSGRILPKDMIVLISLYGIHRNPLYWGDDVKEFRPERFIDDPLKHSAFMGFSVGPRNCIGFAYATLSVKTVIVTLLRHYRLLPNSEEELGQPIDAQCDFMLRAADGFKVVLEPLPEVKTE